MGDEMISVILLFYNRTDMMMKRMVEIHQHIHHPNKDIEILLVNNGSDPSKIEKGQIYYWQKMVNWFTVRYIEWETNVGFGGGMNRGASKAEGDYIILLSDDVRIGGDFITPIKEILDQEPNTLVGGEVIWWPGGWNEFEVHRKKVVVPYANGWLLATSKPAWKESGGFDPIYDKFDYEDMDLSTRWHEMNYPIKSLNSPVVSHIGGATINQTNPDREQHTQLNRLKYIEKWCDRLLSLNTKNGG
jgi:GT2 family glycosyltransferase